ncbi:phosphoglucomutase/phosphomannomutase alpha/beta/alpha domain I [Candidatus Vecturithrix granuli]|uniref:Phosphoglucomutase/phosphomannomutase alpha/beta/alpha domain I n=1 Tax=Vecturithrix granuli TaxID=1499967 RepID=A0A081BY90_VECG1|nr:phosphoglucomutase/phosphomannomutase alpha/beta/alpha domain I [Candidatus Vecturithrix granuli]
MIFLKHSNTFKMLERLIQARANGKISDAAYKSAQKWLTDQELLLFRDQVATLIREEQFDELEDAFYTMIPFGTGGRRGTCGVGPNRINTRTIGESAQGLAAYISQFGVAAKQRGVVIAYDTRNNSKQFAEYSAQVLCGNGITTYLFREFRSTPELSFAVRELGTIAGIVISASHNPPSDNGFKVYWEDGGQVVPPHDRAIIAEVNKVNTLQMKDLQEAERQGLFSYVSNEIDQHYIAQVAALSLIPNRSVRLVYSPLHGTGQTSILPVLRLTGFQDLHLVEAQMAPDGNFPNVHDHFPNPELPAASEMAMELAQQVDADVGFTSDPDADRLGVFCKHVDPEGQAQWMLLNGNQVGVLLTDFIGKKLKDQGQLPEKGVVVKTMVTTDMVSEIARDYGLLTVDDLLVGFKYIAEVIRNLPPDQQFIFGAEESLGYLRGDFVRDKDAATAALLLAEMAAELKSQKRSLYDHLNSLYRKYGYFLEMLKNVYVSGAEGTARVARMMEGLRAQPPLSLAGKRVIEVIDRQAGAAIAPETRKTLRPIGGTKGNVLVFVLSEDRHTRVTIRPSGTEPKIKYYGAIRKDVSLDLSFQEFEQLKAETRDALQSYVESLATEAEKRG